MKELELQGKSKPNPLPLDSSKILNVKKHTRLISAFKEKDVDIFFTY